MAMVGPIEVKLRVAFWVRPYLALVALLARLGIEPDFDKVERRVSRGVRPIIGN